LAQKASWKLVIALKLSKYRQLGIQIESSEGITMTDAQTITINEKEYVFDDLSDAAKAQLVSLQVTDQEISRLQKQQNIAQTARNAYAQALNAELPKDA